MKMAVKELTKLSLCYPATKYSSDEVRIMAGMWVESFENISDDVFVDACRLHREGSHWFPTVKEILDRCKDVWAARQRATLALPEPEPNLSPEQIKVNVEKIRRIVRDNLEKVRG